MTSRKIAALMGLMLAPAGMQAQGLVLPAESVQVRLAAGTISPWVGVSVRISVLRGPEEGEEIDAAAFRAKRDEMPMVKIRRSDGSFDYQLKASSLAASRVHISYFETVTNEDQFLPFSSGDSYLDIAGPLTIPLRNGSNLVLTPEVLRRASSSRLALSETQKDDLIKAKGGSQSFYGNKFDLGLRADTEDSAKQQLYVSFSFSTLMPGTDCWTISGKGTLTSASNGTFNELKLYPLSLGKFLMPELDRSSFAAELKYGVGFEGDQSFRTMRFSNRASVALLLPNFLNLSQGHDRLRLKPVVTLTGEYWNEIRDANGLPVKSPTYKLGGEIYYYVPVEDRYSFLVEGTFGAVMGDEYKRKYALSDIVSKFDVTFGYYLPDQNVKVIAKYSFGQSDIHFVEDRMVMIGLLLDAFK
jgi:hypothetical protein